MTQPCLLTDQEAQATLTVRKRSSVQGLPQVLGPAWGTIMQFAAKIGVQPSGPPFVAYRNMDMQDLDLEIGFPFAGKVAGEGEVLPGEIPGGKLAECLHVGPYSAIGATYKVLQDWVRANGHAPTGVAYEIYLNDPQVTPPAELRTRVVFPLK